MLVPKRTWSGESQFLIEYAGMQIDRDFLQGEGVKNSKFPTDKGQLSFCMKT